MATSFWRKRSTRLLLIVLGVTGLGAGSVAALQSLVQPTVSREGVPTARVARGDLDLTVFARGETRPLRTGMLIAPPVRGTLQITSLLRTGTRVKEGDTVVEFDPSEQEFNIEQARNELLQAEQEITKAKADGEVQAAQDQVALLKAKFDVRRAELEVGRNELVSAIDAKKNQLSLDEARRRLAQLEQDVQARQVTIRAAVAVQEQRRNKERLDLERALQDTKNMLLKAPFDGLVAVKENWDSTGGFFTTGMVLPEYRPGDLVFPGRTIAEILDVSQMEVLAKINENNVARIKPGQAVEIRLDARPLQVFAGKVKSLASQATRGPMWEIGSGTGRKFDVTFVLDAPDVQLRPGVTSEVKISGEQVKNVLLLPRQAIFEKEGKLIVYVRKGGQFEAVEVKVLHRTDSQAAIEGLAEGTEVALADPEKAGDRKPGKAGGPMVKGGGS